MLFLRNETFKGYLKYYPITSCIIALNIVLFAVDFLFLDKQITYWGLFYAQSFYNDYGLDEPWRYVTSITLHGSFDHLLFNTFAIVIFAPPLERLFGHARYLLFYLVSGVFANVFSVIVYSGEVYPSVGASGAIYGLFGAYLYLAIFRRFAIDESTRKTIYITLIFGLIYSVIVPNISISAHVGGAISGFALMSLYAYLRTKRVIR
ncbi:MAG: rhomboid family intramembrane serine protease [Candidatus Cohnella colombiensis]|uniref:Rhomboid family intramembrane serine protease n=1 Tax=Candidatus Cohnella colombiensis TaxID=3121368 RepID=A0AA95F1F0_9BACL|nr:MAG: rhomboid family intramembrane serine protease [Cohnella sp.]